MDKPSCSPFINKSVALVGLPGSGKSTIGQLLAETLKVCFYDTDQLLEQRFGCSIPEYFEDKGEAAFREQEKQLAVELTSVQPLLPHPYVLATGGGFACNAGTMNLLNSCYTSIYLSVTTDLLQQRLERNTLRPLLSGLSRSALTKKLVRLQAERHPFYSQAHFTVNDAIEKQSLINQLAALCCK